MGQLSLARANYDLLIELDILSEEGQLRECSKLQSSGFMDLVLEPLPFMNSITEDDAVFFSLAHYRLENGDMCQDPEMVLMAYPDKREVHAFSFQQAIPPIYHEVFDENGRERKMLRNQLNSFLHTWITTGIQQQFDAAQWKAA